MQQIQKEAQKVEPDGRSCDPFSTYSIHTKQTPLSAPGDWKQEGCRQWVQGGGQAGLLAMRMCMEMQMWMQQQQEAMAVAVGLRRSGVYCQCGRAGWLIMKRPETGGQQGPTTFLTTSNFLGWFFFPFAMKH